MRKIKTRIFAILMVVTVATFTVCKATGANSGVDISGGEKVTDQADDDATLLSLSVTYTDKTGNLVGGFTPEDLDYSFSAANGEMTATVSATAASSKASLVISYGDAGVTGQSVANGSNIMLPVTGSKVLSVTVTAENSDTQTYTVTIAAYIAQTAPPPTGSGNADYTLQLLSVIYSGQTENKVEGFDTANTNYSFNVAEGYETATVFAAVSSSHSSLDITYGEANADAPQDISIVNGGVITLPVAGSKVLKIKVTAQNNNTQTYYVTINAYVAVTKNYSGTIAYSGGSKSIIGVVGRDAAFVTQSADLTGSAWTLTVPDGYIPKSFVVTFSDGTYSYRSKALYPAVVSTSSSITLTIVDPVDIGRQVASAIDLADFATGANYSLADDVTLPDTWIGPTGYTGSFYGNGYAVNLHLADVASNTGSGKNTGLFTSLANGAKINDLVLNVSTPDGGLAMGGSNYFGGLVGIVNASNCEMWINGVTVNGKLKYASSAGNWLVVGGLFGGISTQSGIVIHINNCVSNLELDADTRPGTEDGLAVDFGGFIGCQRGTVFINDSYATGAITAIANNYRRFKAGGLVSQNQSGALTIEHCYATGTIAITKSGGTVAGYMYAGGLIGYVNATATIRNSAALNTSVTVDGAASGTRAANRVSGLGGSLQNNFALSTMNIGVAPGAPVVSSDANNVNGADKTLIEFKTTTPWTALGFSADVWDFSTISAQGRPTLK